MLKQQYDANAFLSVIKKDDIRKWTPWKERDEKDSRAIAFANSLIEKQYCIDPLQKSSRKGKTVYYPSSAEDYFALKLLDRYLRRIYKVVQADRSKIIRQIHSILEDGGDFTLIRADIKSFYESIDFNKCINKIRHDMILTPSGVSLLVSLKDRYNEASVTSKGVPRGIGISATMSEIYLRGLDENIRSCRDVVYYSRYVDDIFMFVDKSKRDNIEELLKKNIASAELYFNYDKKSTDETAVSCSLSYLGYYFEVKTKSHKRTTTIQIAPEKVNKIKQRIYKSFLDYKKGNNFQLLLNRLRYLSCNIAIKKTENGNLMGGNAYNYCYVTDPKCFKVFDGFIAGIISSFNLDPSQVSQIKRISFYRAFVNKIVISLTRRQIAKIKEIWVYER